MLDAYQSSGREIRAIPEESLNLPCDHSRVDSVRSVGNIALLPFPPALQKDLAVLKESLSLPLSVIHLAAFSVMLFRYSGQNSFYVVIPHDFLSEQGEEIADPTNIVPLLVQLSEEDVFIDTVNNLQRGIQDSLQRHSVSSLDRGMDPQQALDGIDPELCQVLMSPRLLAPVFQDPESALSSVDWQLALGENHSTGEGQLYFRADLFEPATVQRFTQHYLRLIETALHNPDLSIGELDFLTQSDRRFLLEQVNNTRCDYPKNETVSRLFSKQADVSGNKVAVRGPDDRTLSYTELERQSNRLAHYLLSRGVGRGSRVGVFLERRVEMLSTLLAVQKAGAAYVPLDPLFPVDRLSYMAEDADLSLIVTQRSLISEMPIEGSEMVILESLLDELGSNEVNAVDYSCAESATFVIYTSGSTGKPKGVQISHRSLVNLLWSVRETPGMSSDDRMLAVTTLSFDIAAVDMYLPLLVGAEMTLASREEAMDSQGLSRRLTSTGATLMQATPATWKMLIESGWKGDNDLRVWCTGEAMSRDLADALLERSDEVWNLYGPSETTIWSTLWRVEKGIGPVPIGLPIANTQVYVLDQAGRLVAPGVAGELFIGGDGLADGYVNRESLTAERFVKDNFSNMTNARLYKTGDRARWRADGQLEVQGRFDDQVKLRGFRIELGEIRTALVESATIRDAVVMVREDDGRDEEIVAYVLMEADSNLDIEYLRDKLKKRMPPYMVPSNWVELEEFPLTPNGKVDKKRLPAPELSQLSPSLQLSESQAKIAVIWQQVLGLKKVGLEDSFFEAGGNSLSAIRFAAKLREQYGLNIPIISLFQGATIADIAEKLPKTNIENVEPKAEPEIDSSVLIAPVSATEQADQHTPRSTKLEISVDSNNDKNQSTNESPVCRLISKSGIGKPFFMLGSNPRYALATEKLDSDVAVYQLDAYALQFLCRNSNSPIPNTIEKIAKKFYTEIKAVQPTGPYRLGGGCEGALISLELALQIQRAGEEVEWLVTWHTPAPGPQLKKSFGGSTIRRFWWQVQSVISGGNSAGIGLRGYLNLMQHEIIEYSLLSAMFKYRPEAMFSGDIELIVLEDDGQHETENSDLWKQDHIQAWRATVTGDTGVYQIKGTHDTWLKDHVDIFGEFLASRLNPLPG